MARRIRPEDLCRELEQIGAESLAELRERWFALNRRHPPARLSLRLLRYGISYQLQEAAHGGLKPSTAKALDRLAAPCTKSARPLAPKLKPGSRLLRRWQGVTHEVEILEDGVLYRGELRRSLTEVAQQITGAHWSGPAFFGLTGKRGRRDPA